MRASNASMMLNDSAAFPPVFGLQSEVANNTPIGADLSLGPAHHNDGANYASVFARCDLSSNREAIVNRLLDWAEEARAEGRVGRADYLVCLAWEAYDRAPG